MQHVRHPALPLMGARRRGGGGIIPFSPSFLASKFIRDYEIPGVGEAPLKKTLPVMLDDVPLDGSMEFHQIDRRQIYRGNS